MRAGPRVGIDITAAISQGGGIGRYARELVAALVALDSTISFKLFSARRPPGLQVAGAIPDAAHVIYRQAPLSERWLYRLWFRIGIPVPVQWITGPIDLYHSPDFVLPPVAGQVPTLLTVHDLSFLHYPETFTPALVRYLSRAVPDSVERADHVLADSQATKDDLLNLWNVDANKVTVLHSGVGANLRPVRSRRRIEEVRRKYDLGDEPFLLTLGTIQPRKNYQMLIRAFKQVAERQTHRLVIVGGKGWLYDEILKEPGRQRLGDRVRFVGFVADEDLPALYSEAALFVFPSLYEGFGLPLLEAMACGAPVLTSDSSSLPEVVGGAAVQLSPHDQESWSDAMIELLEDPAKRASMVAAGFLQARRFTWHKAAQELSQLYLRLLSR